jgi:hypothetical protein
MWCFQLSMDVPNGMGIVVVVWLSLGPGEKMKMGFLILFRIISKISVKIDWKVSHTNKVQKLLLF